MVNVIVFLKHVNMYLFCSMKRLKWCRMLWRSLAELLKKSGKIRNKYPIATHAGTKAVPADARAPHSRASKIARWQRWRKHHSKKYWFCILWTFITIIPGIRALCQILAKSSGDEFQRTQSKLKKRKKNSLSFVYVHYEIRHFRFVVGQERQRNAPSVENSIVFLDLLVSVAVFA